MIRHSKIEWTESTWNRDRCTKISEGCQNCYAERMARRLKLWAQNYTNGFTVTCHPNAVELPLGWKKAQIFLSTP